MFEIPVRYNCHSLLFGKLDNLHLYVMTSPQEELIEMLISI